MMMDRREFLAATPLVFGLDALLAQEPGRPAWIDAALRRMKDTGRFGLVLVAPEGDPLQRRVGLALWDLTRSTHVRGLLAEAVVLCVLPAHAKALAAESGRLVLLSPDGLPADAAPLAVETLEDPVRFAATADALLRGRRERRAAEIRAGLTADLRAALNQLDVDDFETREKVLGAVAAAADRIAPLLAHLARTGRSEELRGRAAQALAHVYELAAEDVHGPRLPYGARIPRVGSAGCIGDVELPEDAPKDAEVSTVLCGMARIPPGPPRRFLRFLSK